VTDQKEMREPGGDHPPQWAKGRKHGEMAKAWGGQLRAETSHNPLPTKKESNVKEQKRGSKKEDQREFNKKIKILSKTAPGPRGGWYEETRKGGGGRSNLSTDSINARAVGGPATAQGSISTIVRRKTGNPKSLKGKKGP